MPLTVTVMLLLLDGRPLSAGALAAFALVVVAVCAAANYGYALNELFDVAEDARAGRTNAAASAGAGRVWTAAALSAACALIAAGLAAGALGALGAVIELCLPLAYSVPPVRVKERGWLAVASDALAAHVFPAVLALLAVAHWSLRPVFPALIVAITVWAAAAGTRGFLSHLIATAERDAGAGLRTIVHDAGRPALERAIIVGVLPLEAIGFVAAFLMCDTGIAARILGVLYLACEAWSMAGGRVQSAAFHMHGHAYVPFTDERFYKAWGPVVLAVDAARGGVAYLLVAAAYVLLFRPQLAAEAMRVRALIAPRPR